MRSGYHDDVEQWALIRWRGAVNSALRGKRGQAFLLELIESLEALPEPKLISGEFATDAGCCAIGSVGLKRGIDMSGLSIDDEWDSGAADQTAEMFGIAPAMVREIEDMNDREGCWFTGDSNSDDEQHKRYTRVLEWAKHKINET